MLKYTDSARNRIQDGLKKYSRIVAQARQRGMTERDTADIIKAMLGDMLGYDPFFDVTTECALRGPFADHAILVDGRLRLLLCVKAIGASLHAAHLLRMSGSSSPAYADWALLSNADTWACYRLGVGQDRHPELVFRASLSDPISIEEKAGMFLLISKEGVQANALEDYWEQVRILNPGRIAALILSDEVLNLVRRELQRTANYRVERSALHELLTRTIIRPEAIAAGGTDGEDGPRHPHCFAYVRNPNDSSTWRLRYRNSDGTPNGELLTMAVAALSEDTWVSEIPADDTPLVKERLRQAYLELGVAPEDLPDVLCH